MASETIPESDARILALFDSPGEVETPTPGVKAWLAGDIGPDGAPRPVIVKRVREGAGTGSRKARATEALQLAHPQILPPRRWLADGGFLYIARDVVRGKNLRQALTTASGERPGPELLRKLLLPLLDALTYAHGQGVVHAGISPENILIADDGRLLLLDYATTDPNAPRHQPNYAGKATAAGDVRALGSVLAAYLPTGGAFSNLAVRGRIEGLIRRSDSSEDLREILNSLEKLAANTPGMSRPKDGVPTLMPQEPASEPPTTIGIPRLEMPGTRPSPSPAEESSAPVETVPPPVTVSLLPQGVHVPQGGGGVVGLHIRNEAPQPILVRMVATQHAWLNVRPITLPLAIPVSGAETLEFAISAARLTPGEYRSEVYLTLERTGGTDGAANPIREKHVSEVRVMVDSVGGPTTLNSQATAPAPAAAGPPFPANAPKISGGPGCAVLAGLLLLVPVGLVPLCLHLLRQ
ncbi:MAG: hypothetical protein SFU56_21290 [Capsulimonadales bacterium]|nr:hypothetical protein [Capsulimonadales bacterium]